MPNLPTLCRTRRTRPGLGLSIYLRNDVGITVFDTGGNAMATNGMGREIGDRGTVMGDGKTHNFNNILAIFVRCQ